MSSFTCWDKQIVYDNVAKSQHSPFPLGVDFSDANQVVDCHHCRVWLELAGRELDDKLRDCQQLKAFDFAIDRVRHNGLVNLNVVNKLAFWLE